MIDLKPMDMQPKKRNRVTVVCTNCKKRKTKCNREKPCDTCTRLGDSETCAYLEKQYKVKLPKGEIIKGKNASLTVDSPRALTPIQASPTVTNNQNIGIIIPLSYHPKKKEYINFIPTGCFIETRRSAIDLYSQFTDLAMEHRDPYLRTMIRFRSIAIRRTLTKFHVKKHSIKLPNLPHSFIPLSLFDAHDVKHSKLDQPTQNYYRKHKALFDKFAKYRRDNSIKFTEKEPLPKDFLVNKDTFMNDIIPFFKQNIFNLLPIFDMDVLTGEMDDLYTYLETHDHLNFKNYDQVVFSIMLLIVLLTQLSIKMVKHNDILAQPLYDNILAIDTSKYVSLINHYLIQIKFLRKCTLMQLQCLMLLRLYHWCAPSDGDGPDAQQNQILMGTIISSCRTIGINWKCILDEPYFIKICNKTRPSLSNMGSQDYVPIYNKIWAVVLHWDRKMCLISGQECLIGKSFSVGLGSDANFPWHTRMLDLDYLILKLSDLLNDFPSHVELNELNEVMDQLFDGYETLKTLGNPSEEHLFYEFGCMLDLLKLSVLQAKMVHYEYKLDFINFHITVQEVWDYLIVIAQKCYKYFYDDAFKNLNPFTKFYTNRIVELLANKLCVLIPGFILRSSRILHGDYEARNLMCKLLFGVSSMYFNEFAFNYYRSFKKMFTAKVVYKLMNRPQNTDAWKIILEFLIYEFQYNDDIDDPERKEDSKLKDMIPFIYELYQIVKNGEDKIQDHTNLIKIWDSEIFPIGKYDSRFKLDLRYDFLEPFLVDKYASTFNIFKSFYDFTSDELAFNAGLTNPDLIQTKSTPDGLSLAYPSRLVSSVPSTTSSDSVNIPITNNPNTSGDGQTNEGNISNGDTDDDHGFANLDLIQGIFEPLDFISYF